MRHQAEDLLDPKDILEEFVRIYQIQWIWNEQILSSNARLIHRPWYNRERSILNISDRYGQTYYTR